MFFFSGGCSCPPRTKRFEIILRFWITCDCSTAAAAAAVFLCIRANYIMCAQQCTYYHKTYTILFSIHWPYYSACDVCQAVSTHRYAHIIPMYNVTIRTRSYWAHVVAGGEGLLSKFSYMIHIHTSDHDIDVRIRKYCNIDRHSLRIRGERTVQYLYRSIVNRWWLDVHFV